MYTPQAFEMRDRAAVIRHMREFSFATLISWYDGNLSASHLPLLVREDGQDVRLIGHMARANSQWRMFDGRTEALAIFQGPHGYISPAWYGVHPSVPTWNYAAVHAYGRPKVVDDAEQVESILADTVEFYESGREEPWAMDFPAGYLEKMAQAIVAFEIPVDRIEGKAKLSQNRSDEDRARVIAALAQSGGPQERLLANMMRDALVRPKDAVQ